MQLKVISTLVFASLAAALALPQAPPIPDKGNLVPPPPKTPLPPPTTTPLPPPPKTEYPPAGTPIPHSTGDNSHTPSQGKPNDKAKDNTHLPRADADLPPKKDLPKAPPKNELPPPPKTSPPPPKTDLPPASTPVPHPANGNDKAKDNIHLPRADADLPPPPKDLPKAPPKNELPPPPPKTTGLPPPPKTGLPPASTPVSHPANGNDKTKNNTHVPRADADLPPKKDLPKAPPKNELPPPPKTSPPPPPKTGLPPASTPVPHPANDNTHKANNFKN